MILTVVNLPQTLLGGAFGEFYLIERWIWLWKESDFFVFQFLRGVLFG